MSKPRSHTTSTIPHATHLTGRRPAMPPSSPARLVVGWVLALLLLLLPSSGKFVLFDNTRPMLDTTGRILDAHDGTIQRFHDDGPYYMHAVEYGLCQAPNVTGCDSPDRCGFRLNHNISIYTSWDLSSGSWAFQGYAFPWTERPAGTVFRPSAVFNPNILEYVLWWNYVYPNGTYAGFAVATSPTPEGPFEQRRDVVPIAHLPAGDFHLFVDPDDGKGYVLYSADFWITIQELTPDYLGVTGRMFDGFRGNQSEWGWEAPVMFKRQGVYYIMFGPMCCFCYQGSGIRVYTATSPLGPYTYQGQDIACAATTLSSSSSSSSSISDSAGALAAPTAAAATAEGNEGPVATPKQGCLFYDDNDVSATRAQQNFVVEVRTSAGETEYLWTGDRWMQSPDGLKGHEPQYWFPLSFDKDGIIGRVTWVDLFVVDVADVVGEEARALPVSVSPR